MDNTATHLDKAIAEYKNALDILHEMCRIRYPADDGKKLSKILDSFEQIVQGIILITVIESGVITPGEWQFFKGFKSYDLLMKRLTVELSAKNKLSRRLTEDSFKTVTEEEKIILNRAVRTMLSNAAEHLYTSYAETDYVTPQVDYLANLKDRITKIILLASLSDGDSYEDEQSAHERSMGLLAFYDIVEKYWKSYNLQNRIWAESFWD